MKPEMIVLLAVLAVVIVALILVFNMIIKPLTELRRAARRIRDGNLDGEIHVSGDKAVEALAEDLEEMRVRLKENAEAKTRSDNENRILISNISHDLKTPITAIKGYVEGIRDGVASTPEKLDKYLTTIYNKANDMDRLIDELTLYSRIDTNRIPYSFEKVDVEEFFGSYAEDAAMDLEANGIQMSYHNYLDGGELIIGDTEQLRRVLNNIISNSVKYMNKAKGIISMRVRDAGDFVQIEIEDNGKGIAKKDLPYIFDRFFRTDSSRNSSTGGSGIGLSIVKKIIEDHGGRIWATSEEGTGTVMHFVLRKYQEAAV